MSDGLHVVIQAGGRGSRLRHHTWNKPKCLVSVRGKPILYHFFDQFPDATFIIIGDYGFDKLAAYLAYNPPSQSYKLVRTDAKGTCSGLADALEYVPEDAPVLITWSDLIIHSAPPWLETDQPVVGTTSCFLCRWTLSDGGQLQEVSGVANGIPGLFYLPRRNVLPPLPTDGEFVKWFSRAVPNFATQDWDAIEELGEFATIENLNRKDGFTRFFNRVEIQQDRVEKTVVDLTFAPLLHREIKWYRAATELGFRRIPRVIAETPFQIERIHGDLPYLVQTPTERERRAILANSLEALIGLHRLGEAPTAIAGVRAVYLDKTLQRIASIRTLIPGFERPSFTVNGLKCRNPFAEEHAGLFEALCAGLTPECFRPIHGDPTFSNTIVDRNLCCWFIDPRGYFAEEGIYGDANYDFAKVYYSAVGNYDAFNRRQFKLYVDSQTVEVILDHTPFADVAEDVFSAMIGSELQKVKIIHGLIWLSLAGYVRDDLDSVIGAFFLGLYWLEFANQS